VVVVDLGSLEIQEEAPITMVVMVALVVARMALDRATEIEWALWLQEGRAKTELDKVLPQKSLV
jgi:hypothetical protein